MKAEHEEHFVGKIAQKVIVVKGDQVLLVQDPRVSDDIWELPGGRMNIDEDPKAAVAREFQEEMGVSIAVGPVVHMEQFIQGSENARAFVIVYTATLVSEDFDLDSSEVSKIGWFTKTEVSTLNLFPEYQRALAVHFAQL